SPQDWQRIKASNVTSPFSSFRVRGTTLYLLPIPAAGATAAFEYVSKNWCSDASGASERDAWAVDSDVGLIPEELRGLGLKWRFLKARGESFGTDFDTYTARVTQELAVQGGRRDLDFARPQRTPQPTVAAPEGSWPL